MRAAWISGCPDDKWFSSPHISAIRPDPFTAWPAGLLMAEREHAFFYGAHAIETPLGIDYGLGALAFGEGFGSEIDEEFGGERSVRGEVFGGKNNDAGGKAVAQCVQAGGLLADIATRTLTRSAGPLFGISGIRPG